MMFLTLVCVTSCSKDDDAPGDPVETVTLNMMNEQNGKTLLGESGVYINKSNNFYTPSNLIADLGQVSGVGVKVDLKLNQLSQEVAVIPGHAYQIFDKTVLQSFPSGNRAAEKGTGYYQAYVVSAITSGDATTGAMVKYFLAHPNGKGLPEVNHKIGVLYNKGETVEMALPKGVECFLAERSYEDVEETLTMSTAGGKLSLTLNKTPDKDSGPYGIYKVYMRLGSVYTVVVAGVGYEL